MAIIKAEPIVCSSREHAAQVAYSMATGKRSHPPHLFAGWRDADGWRYDIARVDDKSDPMSCLWRVVVTDAEGNALSE